MRVGIDESQQQRGVRKMVDWMAGYLGVETPQRA
jgi:hypothetical protein